MRFYYCLNIAKQAWNRRGCWLLSPWLVESLFSDVLTYTVDLLRDVLALNFHEAAASGNDDSQRLYMSKTWDALLVYWVGGWGLIRRPKMGDP